jgi:hypothetical protein
MEDEERARLTKRSKELIQKSKEFIQKSQAVIDKSRILKELSWPIRAKRQKRDPSQP